MKSQEFVAELLSEASEEEKEQLANLLRGPLVNLYLFDGPTVQALHSIYMKTVFQNREEYKRLLNIDIEEYQAEMAKLQAQDSEDEEE